MIPAPVRDAITEAQLRLPRRSSRPRHPEEFFVLARWWELESQRGYASAGESRRYAQTMAAAGWARVADGTIRPYDPSRDARGRRP